MTKAEKNKLLAVNATLWIVAMLLHPLAQVLPTGSSNPPKIFELLIPMAFLMLTGASMYLLNAAIGEPKNG
jgi:hypothetical protein